MPRSKPRSHFSQRRVWRRASSGMTVNSRIQEELAHAPSHRGGHGVHYHLVREMKSLDHDARIILGHINEIKAAVRNGEKLFRNHPAVLRKMKREVDERLSRINLIRRVVDLPPLTFEELEANANVPLEQGKVELELHRKLGSGEIIRVNGPSERAVVPALRQEGVQQQAQGRVGYSKLMYFVHAPNAVTQMVRIARLPSRDVSSALAEISQETKRTIVQTLRTPTRSLWSVLRAREVQLEKLAREAAREKPIESTEVKGKQRSPRQGKKEKEAAQKLQMKSDVKLINDAFAGAVGVLKGEQKRLAQNWLKFATILVAKRYSKPLNNHPRLQVICLQNALEALLVVQRLADEAEQKK